MAFEIARVHSAISTHLEAPQIEAPVQFLRRPLPMDLNCSLGRDLHLQAFPSPRTWHATRGASVSETCASSDVSSDSGDLDSDAGAEIAEWMAQSCISDDESPAVQAHKLPLSFDHLSIRTRVPLALSPASASIPASRSGSRAVSWSSACSSESSQGASPTSVLGESGLAEWDLLFAAAGEVQKLAREQDVRGIPQSRRMEQLLGRTQSIPGKSAYGSKPPASLSRTQSVDSTPSPLGMHSTQGRRQCTKSATAPLSRCSSRAGPVSGRKGWTTDQKVKAPRGSGEARNREGLAVVDMGMDRNVAKATLGSPAKELGNGTGVFLPRVGAAAPPAEEKPSRKVSKPTTVVLPARLVEALGLNVDQENNVVLNCQVASSQRRPSSIGGMKMAVEEGGLSRCRNGSNRQKKTGGSPSRPQTQSRAYGKTGAPIVDLSRDI